MAVTFTPTTEKVYVIGDRQEALIDIACTGTPTVGGDDLTAAALGFTELDTVDPCGAAGVVGGTSGVPVQIIHEPGGDESKVKVVFLAQGTAGAANAMVAYTGATAGFVLRVRATGKGKVGSNA